MTELWRLNPTFRPSPCWGAKIKKHRNQLIYDALNDFLKAFVKSFVFVSAERQGFEPRVPRSTTVFKTAAIDHSATSPKYVFKDAFLLKRCKDTNHFLFYKLFCAKKRTITLKSQFISAMEQAQWNLDNLSGFINNKEVVCNSLFISTIKRAAFSIRLNPIQYTTESHSVYDWIRFRIQMFLEPAPFVNNADYHPARFINRI